MDRNEMLSLITKWSSQMELTIREIEDPNVDFHLVVSEPGIISVDVIHPKPESAFVLLATRITVREEDQKKMLDMELEQREEFLWDIRFKLLSTNIEFRMTSPEVGIPTSWEIQSKFFLDGAIAQHFSDLYVKMKNTILGVIWLYRRTLDKLKSGI